VFDSVTLAPEITPAPTYHQNHDSDFLIDKGRRMANSLSIASGSMRAGVLQYRNRQGKHRYGFGYRKMLGNTKLDAVLNKEGVLLAMNNDRLLYNLNISNHQPHSNKRTTFVQFSIQAYW
jgi:hypothetical protein